MRFTSDWGDERGYPLNTPRRRRCQAPI